MRPAKRLPRGATVVNCRDRMQMWLAAASCLHGTVGAVMHGYAMAFNAIRFTATHAQLIELARLVSISLETWQRPYPSAANAGALIRDVDGVSVRTQTEAGVQS